MGSCGVAGRVASSQRRAPTRFREECQQRAGFACLFVLFGRSSDVLGFPVCFALGKNKLVGLLIALFSIGNIFA